LFGGGIVHVEHQCAGADGRLLSGGHATTPTEAAGAVSIPLLPRTDDA
jgi:hypothetical protein